MSSEVKQSKAEKQLDEAGGSWDNRFNAPVLLESVRNPNSGFCPMMKFRCREGYILFGVVDNYLGLAFYNPNGTYVSSYILPRTS